MSERLWKYRYWTLACIAVLALAGLAACDPGGATPTSTPTSSSTGGVETSATVDPGVPDRPSIDGGPSGLTNASLACGQNCSVPNTICMAGGDTCVVFCLDMEGPTGRPLAADCYDDGDPAGWCVDLNNDHVCDAGVGTSTSYSCVDATLDNINAMRGGVHRTLCSTDGNPPFGCPADLTCSVNGGGAHTCSAAFCPQQPSPDTVIQPDITIPPPVERPTQTVTEPPPEEPPSCYCEVDPATNAWNGDYICTKADGTVISKIHDTSLCPLPKKPGGGNNGGGDGGDAVCGNGKVEKGEECESDSDCKGNKAGNSCFVPGCFCGPG